MVSLSELAEHRNDPSQHCLTLGRIPILSVFGGK
jgi:hypothetical protein